MSEEQSFKIPDLFREHLRRIPKTSRDSEFIKYFKGPVRQKPEIGEEMEPLLIDTPEDFEDDDISVEDMKVTFISPTELEKLLQMVSEQVGYPVTVSANDPTEDDPTSYYETIRREVEDEVYTEALQFLVATELRDKGTMSDILESARKHGEAFYEFAIDTDVEVWFSMMKKSQYTPRKLAFFK